MSNFIKALSNLAPSGWSSLGTWETVIWHDDAPEVRPTLEQVYAEISRIEIRDRINALEAQITPRRIREALTDAKGAKAWLIAKETEIQTLRDELKLLQ